MENEDYQLILLRRFAGIDFSSRGPAGVEAHLEALVVAVSGESLKLLTMCIMHMVD